MRTAFEFVLERIRKSANQQTQLSQSLRYLYNLTFSNVQKVHIFRITGLVENSDRRITTLFFGNEQGANQFASLVYHQIDKILRIRELRFSQITSAIAANGPEIVAVRVEKPAADEFEKQGYLLLPNVSFNLDLRRTFDGITKSMSRRRRRDIKKIEALNYSYTICRENDEDFSFFYRKMYMPYSAQRFGKAAYIKRYDESKAFYRTGGAIIFVKKCEKPVAGILFRTIGKTLYAISMGLCQHVDQHTEQLGGQAALLFLVKWAKMRGLESLDYGTSLPFFREGVFMYKKEWGMSLEQPTDQSYCALKLNSLDSGALLFLQQNPFIICDNGMLKGVVFLNHKPTIDELQQTFSEYFLPKLSSIIFIAYYKSNTELLDKAEPITKPVDSPQVLSRPLSDICSLLQKDAFTVEVRELSGLNENRKNANF